ncbi:MAG: patatin-like phospholipase family protein [Myxococcota bacterium]
MSDNEMEPAGQPRPKTAICLTGGGFTGGLYQLGALSALQSVVDAPAFDLIVGTSSGASVAAALAGGLPVPRMYRALIDPADNYFPLERAHILALDAGEWRRTISSGMSAIRHGLASLMARSPAPMPADLWEQLDRLFDALPAGLLSLDRYERFLADFFLRRRVPNSFRSIQRELLITATDLDSGEVVLFGGPNHDYVPVSLACTASMALPLFFSPVRIGDRYYVDGSVAPTTEIDIAAAQGAELIIVLNPNAPIDVGALPGGVPTGHGMRQSLRDKGLMWVYNQAMRTSIHARLSEAAARVSASGNVHVLLLEPEPEVAARFVSNVVSLPARREIMHASHRASRERFRRWACEHHAVLQRHGWHLREAEESVAESGAQASP